MDKLPAHLVHDIMALLPFKEAVRFSVLSRWYQSVWRSFPILEFDFGDFPNFHDLHDFFRLVFTNIRNRSTGLRKLSIRSNFHSNFDPPLAPNLVCIAKDFRLQELELINMAFVHWLILPENIFHLTYLTVLKLDSFKFSTPNIVLNRDSMLKKLRLVRTLGLETLVFTENTSLEYLEVHYCSELELVDLDALNLEYFHLLTRSSWHNPPELAISSNTSKSLKTLILNVADVSRVIFQETTPIGQLIPSEWANLKTVEIVPHNLGKIDLVSHKLEHCDLDFKFTRSCEVNFLYDCGQLLKSLSLSHSKKITGDWIQQILPLTPLLESLRLEGCENLEWIKICGDKIQHLWLLYCNLDTFDVDCPILETIEISYRNKVPSQAAIRSGPFNAKLSLHFHGNNPVNKRKMHRFLVPFENSKELTLNFKPNFDHMFPHMYESGHLRSPLYDVNHAKIVLTSDEEQNHAFLRLWEQLFSLFLRPKSITLITSTKDLLIKLGYFRRNYRCYCNGKCWTHQLFRVQFSNFNNRKAKDMAKKRIITSFFKRNAVMLMTIRDV